MVNVRQMEIYVILYFFNCLAKEGKTKSLLHTDFFANKKKIGK